MNQNSLEIYNMNQNSLEIYAEIDRLNKLLGKKSKIPKKYYVSSISIENQAAELLKLLENNEKLTKL